MTINDCGICASSTAATQVALVRWKSGTPEFTSEPRCVDRVACRERVEKGGNEWLVADPNPLRPTEGDPR